MKKHFLILASLTALAGSTMAQVTDEKTLSLPSITVTAERRNDAEKAIDAGLAELKESAKSFPLMLTGRAPAESSLAGKTPPKATPAAKPTIMYRVAIKA